jgi:hypothetical protein
MGYKKAMEANLAADLNSRCQTESDSERIAWKSTLESGFESFSEASPEAVQDPIQGDSDFDSVGTLSVIEDSG